MSALRLRQRSHTLEVLCPVRLDDGLDPRQPVLDVVQRRIHGERNLGIARVSRNLAFVGTS